MNIKKLSPEVQSMLRTGIAIVDITQCVSELVQNSLDANASSIAVRLNLENFTLQVVDNGHGLTKDELDVIGQRYMTSKCHSMKDLKTNLSYYGFRGESLASIRESCAVLMIMSKSEGCEQTYSKVFRAGKKSHEAVVSSHNRLCVGTTVVVKDFLYNLPVRRARIHPAIEIESVRHNLISLSIINYKVSFTLRNDISKLIILQTKEFLSSEDALNYHCNLKEPHNLMTVSSNESRFKISAHISRETEPSGSFQFIYVNGRLIKNKRLYELVNKHLSKTFSMRNIGKEVKGKDDVAKEKSFPVFIIHIQCPFSEYDIISDPKKVKVEFKRWDSVEKSLETVINRFVFSEFCDLLRPSCNLEEKQEINVDASNTASHNDHAVKSNVLLSKPVTRPTADNVCENSSEDHITSTKCYEAVQNTKNNETKNITQLKPTNIIVNDEINSKGVEVMDQLNPTCQLVENANCKKADHQKNSSVINSDSDIKQVSKSNQNEKEVKSIEIKDLSLESAVKQSGNFIVSHKKNKCYNKVLPYKLNANDPNKIIPRNGKKESILSKSDLENACSFKAPKPVTQHVKRKFFTEHILTESEVDVTPAKKLKYLSLKRNKNCLNSFYPTAFRTSSNLKRSKFSEHILTDSKKNESFKTSQPHSLYLTEHVLTESGTDISSVKHICSQPQGNSREPKSILPVISHEFFNDTLKNMCQTQNMWYNCLLKNSTKEMSRSAIQVELSRSLKQIPNSNALRLTQKNTLKYLCSGNGYNHSTKVVQPILRSEEIQSSILPPKFQESFFKPKVNLNKVPKKVIEISHEENTNSVPKKVCQKSVKFCKLKQNWKLFSPKFTTVKTSKTYKAIIKPKSYNKCSDIKLYGKRPSLQIRHTKIPSINKVSPNLHVLLSDHQECKFNEQQSKAVKLNQGAITKTDHKLQLKIGKTEKRYEKNNIVSGKDRNIHKDYEIIDPMDSSRNRYKSQAADSEKAKISFNLENLQMSSNTMNSRIPEIDNRKQYITCVNRFPPNNSISPYLPFINFDTKLLDAFSGEYCNMRAHASDNFERLPGSLSKSSNKCNATGNKNVNLSPNVTIFNFHPDKAVFHKQLGARFYLDAQYDKGLKFKPGFNNCDDIKTVTLSSDQNPTLKSHSQEDGYVISDRSRDRDVLSNISVPEHLHPEPLKYCFDFDQRNSPDCHSLNIPGNKTPNILSDIKQKDVFSSAVIAHDTSKVKPCKRNAINEGGNFNHDERPAISNNNPFFLFNQTTFNQTTSKSSLFHSFNCKTKKSRVEQIPSSNLFESSNLEQTFGEKEIDQNFHNVNTDATVKCHDNLTKNDIEVGNEENVPFKNSGYRDANVTVEEHRLEPSLTSDIKLTRESLNETKQSDKPFMSNWNKETTMSGKVFYINRLTGMSSFTTPIANNSENSFIFEGRHWFMPKGISPILNIGVECKQSTKELTETEKDRIENLVKDYKDQLKNVKWTHSSARESKGIDSVITILKEKDNFEKCMPSFHWKKPCVFSSTSLFDAQVIGQVDKKFIATILQPNEETNRFLVLFDQHAVDERIRLESLMSGYKKTDGKLKSHELNFAVEVNLSETEVTLLKDLLERVSKLGLNIKIQENKVTATEVPLCLFNRYTKEGENKDWLSEVTTALVKQLIHSAQDRCRVMPSIPTLLSDIINTEACRGSIKFGDILTVSLCQLLISKLAACEIPFQCAHGRPVLSPLSELDKVENKVESINLEGLARRIQSRECDET